MNAPKKLTHEQITQLYADFGKTACNIYNARGSIYPSVTLVGYPEGGGLPLLSEMPREITARFFALPEGQHQHGMARFASFIDQVFSTERGIREQLPFEPDAVVYAFEATSVPARLNEPEPNVDIDPRRQDGIVVQVITAHGTFGGFSKIEGDPKKAIFNPKFGEAHTKLDVAPADSAKH